MPVDSTHSVFNWRKKKEKVQVFVLVIGVRNGNTLRCFGKCSWSVCLVRRSVLGTRGAERTCAAPGSRLYLVRGVRTLRRVWQELDRALCRPLKGWPSADTLRSSLPTPPSSPGMEDPDRKDTSKGGQPLWAFPLHEILPRLLMQDFSAVLHQSRCRKIIPLSQILNRKCEWM